MRTFDTGGSKMTGERYYGSDSYWEFMTDSSNHAHDGANGHEGVPERLQREAKEFNLSLRFPIEVLPMSNIPQDVCGYLEKTKKEIAQMLLRGEI